MAITLLPHSKGYLRDDQIVVALANPCGRTFVSKNLLKTEYTDDDRWLVDFDAAKALLLRSIHYFECHGAYVGIR